VKQIKKQYKHGLKFDSKLELFFYDLLKKEKIDFEFQVQYVLHPSFKYGKSTVRAMTLTVDFDLTGHGLNIIVDTKGFMRPDNVLKWKMFKYLMKDTHPDVHFPRNQKQCAEVVDIIKSCKFANNQNNPNATIPTKVKPGRVRRNSSLKK
jgi:hypothetical protein